MNNKQIAFGLITTLVIGGTIYFGFVKKYQNGLTFYQKLIGEGVDLSKIDRPGAIIIIEQASGGKKMQGTYNDDYLIARAKALMLREEFFYLGTNKYNTKTGRQVAA